MSDSLMAANSHDMDQGRVDLHVHTSASDGSLSPREVVCLAAELGLAGIAITDHDTIDGVAEGQAAAIGTGVVVVPGVEISVAIDYPSRTGRARSMHLLVYHLSLDGALAAKLRELQAWRCERNERMLVRLAELGMVMTMDEVRGTCRGQIGRPHFGYALVRRGYARDLQDSFDRFLKDGQPAYLRKRRLKAEDAISLARSEGAVPVVAHPGSMKMNDKTLKVAFAAWKESGLCGVEVDHSQHDKPYRSRLRKLAAHEGLLATGGSDFHGAPKPGVALGSGRRGNVQVPVSVLGELASLVRR
jgi:3',5'-nucleoside bisphosphate phosphatase